MRTVLTALAPLIIAGFIYLAIQAQSVDISSAGLLAMGIIDNPKYVKFEVFLMLMAAALLYYRKFSEE